MARISHFECPRCGETVSASAYERSFRSPAGAKRSTTLCPKCSGVLLARYDLVDLRKTINWASLSSAPANLWRYAAVLPEVQPLTLGEGFTPLLPSRENPNLIIKDEGLNPTGTFKARGLSVTVAVARAQGLRKLALASAGNAAGALAAYAAAAALQAFVFIPKDAPQANLVECRAYGAHVTLVDGFIGDCACKLAEQQQAEGFYDLSLMSFPFRVEGKKTMGYELAEQMGWKLPDAIIYPTGGGIGLVGIWKALAEMEQLGWLPPGIKHPRIIAVQSSGCAPIVKAWDEGKAASAGWPNPRSVAAGLCVPKAYADYLVLDILRASGGTAVAVTDEEIMQSLRHWARTEGLLASPEGAATLAGYRRLIASGFLQAEEKVVLLNTGSGLKYVDVVGGTGKQASAAPAPRAIGGIIQPY